MARGTLNWSPVSLIQVDLTFNSGTVNMLADGSADTFASNSSVAVNGTAVLNAGKISRSVARRLAWPRAPALRSLSERH